MIDWDSLVVGPTTDAFGEPVTYSPADGVSFPITGVFDEAYLAQMPIGGLEGSDIASSRPALGIQLSQFPAGWSPGQDDVLTIIRTGETFQVGNLEPDGKGAAMLLLNSFTPAGPL